MSQSYELDDEIRLTIQEDHHIALHDRETGSMIVLNHSQMDKLIEWFDGGCCLKCHTMLPALGYHTGLCDKCFQAEMERRHLTAATPIPQSIVPAPLNVNGHAQRGVFDPGDAS